MTYGRYGAQDKGVEVSKPGCRWGKARQAGMEPTRRVAVGSKSPR